jgi:hypothetical protein
MSLCYDFQKWTILSMALVAISLTVGLLMQYAHGIVDGNNNGKDDVKEYLNDTSPENQQRRYMNCYLFDIQERNQSIDWIWNGNTCELKEIK